MGEPAVVASVLVVLATTVVALVLVATGRRAPLPTVAVVGTIVLVVVATALPTHWSGEGGAQFRPVLLHGGLGGAGRQLLAGDPGAAVELFVLNGVVYLPLGSALAWRWPSRVSALMVPLVVSIGVEGVQYLALERVAATDDVILNVTGAVIGWMLVWWLHRSRADRSNPAASSPRRVGVGPWSGP